MKQLLRALLPVKGDEFARRMKQRFETFWKSPDADEVSGIRLTANDPIEKWKEGYLWQRKLSNKFNSREFALKHGCRVPQLYWKGKDIRQCDFTQLPPQFVIKPTNGHSSRNIFLMKEGFNVMDQQTYSEAELINAVSQIPLQPYADIIIEEFIRSEDGEYRIPTDYKVYIFNEHIAVIGVVNRLPQNQGLSSFYDERWKKLENYNQAYPHAPYQQPPHCLPEIIAQAKMMSRLYELFVRVDFYASDKGAVFGEITPTPAMGKNFTPAAVKKFIRYWDTYCPGTI